MRNYNYILLVGVALFAFSACNKENNLEDSAQVNGPVYETVGVKLGVESKVTLSGGGAKSAFEEGDKIAVWTEAGNFQTCAVDGSGKITVNISEGVRSNYAVYYNGATAPTYDGTLSITLPASYNLVDVSGTKNPVPMVAKNVSGDANDMVFYAVGGLFRLTVNSIPDDATGLLVDFHGHKVSGAFAVSNPGTTTPSIATTSDNTNDKITVTFAKGATGGSAIINIPLPTGDYTDVSVTPIGGSTKVSSTRHIKGQSYTAKRAYGKQLTTTLVSFTINAGDDKVVFAPGNLQAIIASYDEETKIATASSWRFAANQYDVLRPLKGAYHYSVGEPYDMFQWVGNSATIDSYGLVTGSTSDFVGDVAGESLKHDWGHNEIGSYAADYWETLASYSYLLHSRNASTVNGVANARFAAISINNTIYGCGLMIFPDNYDHPASLSAKQPDNINVAKVNGLTLTNYTYDEWKLMEDAGAVFLPRTGYRGANGYDYDIVAVAGQCLYWTNVSGTSTGANVLFHYPNATNGEDDRSRGMATTVRLVRSLNLLTNKAGASIASLDDKEDSVW